MQLDLRLPSVSGRLHALFDLQVSLDEEIASSNPKNARRTRVIRPSAWSNSPRSE